MGVVETDGTLNRNTQSPTSCVVLIQLAIGEAAVKKPSIST